MYSGIMEILENEPNADLVAMVNKSSIAVVVCNPRLQDNPIIICNDAFLKLTGYSREEVIGYNCRFLVGKETDPEKTKVISDAIRNHQPALVEILNYKRDGTVFLNALMIAPMFDDEGKLAYYLGSQMEIVNGASRAILSRRSSAIEKIDSLTPKQRDVLVEMARGSMNKQIAHTLNISASTVKMHRAQVLSKLGLSTTAEAIRVAVEAGL